MGRRARVRAHAGEVSWRASIFFFSLFTPLPMPLLCWVDTLVLSVFPCFDYLAALPRCIYISVLVFEC